MPLPDSLEGSCHCGAVRWTFSGQPESATACNCTICRRYGVLWIYGHEGLGVGLSGPTTTYRRTGAEVSIEFHFCGRCGCVAAWRGLALEPDGRRRMAVNLRLADPDHFDPRLPIEHFEGLTSFTDLGRDRRTVADHWF